MPKRRGSDQRGHIQFPTGIVRPRRDTTSGPCKKDRVTQAGDPGRRTSEPRCSALRRATPSAEPEQTAQPQQGHRARGRHQNLQAIDYQKVAAEFDPADRRG